MLILISNRSKANASLSLTSRHTSLNKFVQMNMEFIAIVILLMVSFTFARIEYNAKSRADKPIYSEQKWVDWQFDPDIDLDVPQIIRRHGYASETHVVEGKGGYLLKVHRIPGRNGAQPVYLQHGLLGSSADWVLNGNTTLGICIIQACSLVRQSAISQ